MRAPVLGHGAEKTVGPVAVREHRTAHDRNMVMYLSLFLLLLVFFIVLTAMSQRRHEKAVATAGSLVAVFGAEASTSRATDERSRPPGDALTDRVGRLIARWSERLPIELLAGGERVQLSLPVSAVFRQADSATLRPEAETFLDELAAMARANASTAPPGLDVVVGSVLVGGSIPDASVPLPVARAAMLAQTLGKAGEGRMDLTVGIEVVDSPRVRLVVRQPAPIETDATPQ